MFPAERGSGQMSRSTVVYLVMLVVLVAGLWIVLEIGARLSPPEDLAGRWSVQSTGGPVGLIVEQSGRYFQLTFDRQKPIALHRVGPGDGPIHLAGGKWKVEIDGPAGSDDRTLHVSGPVPIDGPAHRVDRTYPADTSQAKQR
jgi:hypothetical protein